MPISLQPFSQYGPADTERGIEPAAANPRLSTKGFRLESMQFRQIDAPTLPPEYPEMQNTQRRLAQKRNIQIRVATGIAAVLAIAAIIEYSMMASPNRERVEPHAAHIAVKTQRATASPEEAAANKAPESPVRQSEPAR